MQCSVLLPTANGFVLRGLTWSSCLVYVDDVIVMSKTFDQHHEHLAAVFPQIQEAQLKLKPTKCHLFRREVKFLGHRVSRQGTAVDPEKTSAIGEWPVPTCVSDVRTFLGICGYYRRYVEGFATIAAPLHQLTRQREVFAWTPAQQKAFEELKTRLVSAPVLAMPSDQGQFVLDVDASNVGVGAVLQQAQDGGLRVVAYGSRTFNRAEANYCITRRETLAAVFGLKQFRQYLLGRKFVLRIDHSALVYLRTAIEPVGQQARWLDFFEQFDFDIMHRKGTSHANADALSRRPCGEACRQCTRQQPGVRAVTTRRRAAQERQQTSGRGTDEGVEPGRDPRPGSVRPGWALPSVQMRPRTRVTCRLWVKKLTERAWPRRGRFFPDENTADEVGDACRRTRPQMSWTSSPETSGRRRVCRRPSRRMTTWVQCGDGKWRG